MNQYVKILRSAFVAGLCISVVCVVNLRVGGVADAFYFMAVPEMMGPELLAIYVAEVVGNFVGCNAYRLMVEKSVPFVH